jgi:hypothetical protein
MQGEPFLERVFLQRLPLSPQSIVLTDLLEFGLRFEYLILKAANATSQLIYLSRFLGTCLVLQDQCLLQISHLALQIGLKVCPSFEVPELLLKQSYLLLLQFGDSPGLLKLVSQLGILDLHICKPFECGLCL